MARHPFGGVVWQTVHYLVGFQRLGHDVYYVEASGLQPSALLNGAGDGDRSGAAASFLHTTLSRFGLGESWAFHALQSDGRCYGLSDARLRELFGSADLVVNLHGATMPRLEHHASGRLVYLETDPCLIQIELHDGLSRTIEFLGVHRAFFTFAENYGRPTCTLPVTDRFTFHATRQPVVLDFWSPHAVRPGPNLTTIGNWKQTGRDVQYRGEVYRWSKHEEFLKFFDLPQRTGEAFELALSPRGCTERDRSRLRDSGWLVRDSLDISLDVDSYRGYIRGSRGEFTVAKDQNVRFRTGWFSDRSATYLAAGRPVITQDTGFGEILPTGEGLFAFSSTDDVQDALDRIRSDPERHSRGARDIAREFFSHDVVLPRLLSEAGV
jgi:hypothetical protein